MTSSHRTRARTSTATALTTVLFTITIADAFHHPGQSIVIVLAAALGAITATLALAAVFAPAPVTRTAARHTLDLLLRLVPWYTPRS
jgi:hypothetical protein